MGAELSFEMWILAAAMSGLLFATLAVRVRRAFAVEELIAASAAACLLLGALIVAVGWSQNDFLYAPPVAAVIAGTAAAAFTVDRLVTASTAADARREMIAGYVAYLAGALIGFYVGFLFSLRGLSW